MHRLIILLLIPIAAFTQPRYDILLKGGHVIDAKNHLSAVRDVAILNGRIAAVAENISATEARKVIDVSSLYVAPGLVDMHVHAFAASMNREYTGEDCVRPDAFTFRACVTTVVDAGSSGWRNFGEFRDEIINHEKTRVFAMLNIVGSGMGGRKDVEQNTNDMDPTRTAEVARRNSDVVVGIKVAHYAGPEWIAVDRGVQAGKLANVPVMVDFATFRPERPFQDLVLKHLRPGDIYTHTYLSVVPMLDANGSLLPYLFEARKRGIIFDVGYGGASFNFTQAIPAIKAGFYPNTISTDLHTGSMNASMKNQLDVMSKFLLMGMPLYDVIKASTWTPAQVIKHVELGNLSEGAIADVAVLNLRPGNFGFYDKTGYKIEGKQKCECEMTIKGGKIVYDLNGIADPIYAKSRK